MYRRITTLLITATALVGTTVLAEPGNLRGHSRMLGKNNPFTVEQLPASRARSKLESLPDHARHRALSWMHRFSFPEDDLNALEFDTEGAVLYADPAPKSLPRQGAAEPGAAGLPELAGSAVDNVFALHSNPEATRVVFLDFDGHTISGTAWNSGGTTLQARPFDLDGNPSSFSSAERSAIAEIWHRVAEDFAAFDIDVTTEQPATFGPLTGRVLITSKTDAHGAAMPYNNAGGVAYIDVWGYSSYPTYYSPALVYYDNLANGTTYIAEASAHEFGHNLGLSHDGSSGTTYYAGHGSGATSWAPIMGNSYYNNVTQWSRGEYSGANNTQDDIAIIAAKLQQKADDHAGTAGAATPLEVEADGQILASNPETDPFNTYAVNKGAIEYLGDQDMFSFNAGAGNLEINVLPAWDAFYRDSRRGANLDIEASLLDADGNLLASSDPTSDTYASLTANVPGGTYYLVVTGVGNGNYSDYASMGQYFITGTVVPGEAVSFPPVADFSFACSGLTCNFVDGSSDKDGSVVAWSWNFGDGNSSTARSPSHSFAQAKTYNVELRVTDDDGLTAQRTISVPVTTPNVPPMAGFQVSCTDLTCNFTDNSSDSDGSVTSWSWNFGDGKSSAASNPSHTYAAAGNYTVTLTVTDDLGASDSDSYQVSVTVPVDNEAPQVYLTSPSPSQDGMVVVSSSSRLTLSAYATDNLAVERIEIWADNKLRCSGISSTSCRWSLRKVKAGDYVVEAKAMDAAGNTSSQSVTVHVNGSSGSSKVKRTKIWK